MKIKNLFNRKWFKSLRSFLRNKATLAEAELWDILKSKQLDGDPRCIKSQSTTPAANKFCNILTIIILRPPLLQTTLYTHLFWEEI